MEIVQRTGDSVKDAQARIDFLTSELRELKRQLSNQTNLPVAISRLEADISEEKDKIQQAKRAEKLALEQELKLKQKTSVHGEFMINIEKDVDGAKIYSCASHPGRKIVNWLAHITDYDQHNFRENSPLFIRQQRERLERADAERRIKEEKEIAEQIAEQHRKKEDYLRKNGFRVQGPVQYT